MVYTYKKIEKLGKVCMALYDLIKINNERIECYNHAKKQAVILNNDCDLLFNDIIAEGYRFNRDLNLKINKLDSSPKIGGYASGFIHKAWSDLKVAFKGTTQNALLNACEYNEEVTQLAYKAALNVSADINNDCFLLIQEQQTALKYTCASLKKCHGVRLYSMPAQTYFN